MLNIFFYITFYCKYIYVMPMIMEKEPMKAMKIAVWKIEEQADWFRSQLILNDQENKIIDSMRQPQRKLHWLSSRYLIRRLLNTDQFIHLESNEYGRPIIHNFNVSISISHSADLSAIAMSNEKEVGIDIEKISDKIERIQHKFLSSDELKWIGKEDRVRQLYACWCAKETLYKIYGKRQLDFIQNIFLESFSIGQRIINGSVQKGNTEMKCSILIETVNQHMLAYSAY